MTRKPILAGGLRRAPAPELTQEQINLERAAQAYDNKPIRALGVDLHRSRTGAREKRK